MEKLTSLTCQICRSDAVKVQPAQYDDLLKQIPDWQIIKQNNIDKLYRCYSFKNFKQAWQFAEKVYLLAEQEGHHPAILVEWGKVSITWWTHAISGLHQNDFICAAKTAD